MVGGKENAALDEERDSFVCRLHFGNALCLCAHSSGALTVRLEVSWEQLQMSG